jgi:hypothetical protein
VADDEKDGALPLGVALMEGEAFDSALNLREGRDGGSAPPSGLVVLTDKRVIQFTSTSRRQDSAYVALQDIDSVEVTSHRRGYAAYVWGGLALLVALMVWRTWADSVWSVPAALAVAFMGAYLVVDHLFSSGASQAIFRAGASRIQCDIGDGLAPDQVHIFVNRLFELKANSQGQTARRSRTFSPR